MEFGETSFQILGDSKRGGQMKRDLSGGEVGGEIRG
jgi:hypothetical protein